MSSETTNINNEIDNLKKIPKKLGKNSKVKTDESMPNKVNKKR